MGLNDYYIHLPQYLGDFSEKYVIMEKKMVHIYTLF